MKFTMISLDPNGVYIGRTANGWLWRWLPSIQQWATIWTGDTESTEN